MLIWSYSGGVLLLSYLVRVCRYNEFDQPVCRVCDIVVKSESLWPAHEASRKHHEVNFLNLIIYGDSQCLTGFNVLTCQTRSLIFCLMNLLS